MLSFAYKRFDGKVPEPGPLDDEDRALLAKVEAGFETVGALYNACKFRAALGEAIGLAREANGYLDRKAPWFQIKEDRQAAATSVYVILRVVDNLKTILAPILPHTAQKLACGASTWGTRGSFLARKRWKSTRKRLGHTCMHWAPAHVALTYDHSQAVGTHSLRSLRPAQGRQCMPGPKASCRPRRRCVGRHRCSSSWTRAWSPRGKRQLDW